nr:uncharacterized protein YKR070W-like [Ipomoea batatas]
MRHLLRTLAHKAVSSSWTRSKAQSSSQSYLCLFSNQLHSQASSSFGIAFDIDGVLLRGNAPIGGSPQALRRLYDDSVTLLLLSDVDMSVTNVYFVMVRSLPRSCTLRVPYVFLTNGGGVPEFKRATELTRLLGINILPLQVIQGHTPFKQLVKRFENEFIVAVGKGEPAEVMSEYGFKNVLSIDEYASFFKNIDPLAQYKKWIDKQAVGHDKVTLRQDPCSERVQAVFVVLCDILRTGGLPGREIAHQPPLFFANDDLAYQALFPAERLGMGAFRIALESVFNSIHPKALEYTSYGKPNPFVFKNAERTLMELSPHCQNSQASGGMHSFKTLYMVGDNPSIDINGARQAGSPWFSILTRTGVFKGKGNDTDYPADLVVDTVEEAVEYILRREFES